MNNDHFIKARRLVSPAKRIILSNVSPSLPHDIIVKEIQNLKFKIVSQMTFIGAVVANIEYKHILSFRRQVYIILEENDKLPESILISYKHNYFRIFLSTDEIRCFSCKKLGHVARQCPEIINNNVITVSADVHSAVIEKSVDTDKEKNAKEIVDIESVETSINLKKRQAPSTPSTEDAITYTNSQPIEITSGTGDDTNEEAGETFKKPKVKIKRLKTIKKTDGLEEYEEFKNFFSENSIEIMSFNQFCEFLTEVKGRQEVYLIAEKYRYVRYTISFRIINPGCQEH